jgi:hypothetical protein
VDTGEDEPVGALRHGLGVSAKVRLALLLLAAAGLASGVMGGLSRLGVPISVPAAAAFHGALMTSGFLGTVISLERAVALGSRWAYAAPLAAGLGTLLPLMGYHFAGVVLWLAAPLLLLATSLAIVARQVAAHTVLLAVAAVAWAVGNAIFATPWTGAAPAWWFTFLVLTIAAERLEMTRLTRRPAAASPLFFAAVALLAAGACLSIVDPDLGRRVFGVALCALAAWLACFDIARRTVRTEGFARYAAVALLAGYAWLAAGGVAWFLGPEHRDASLHALGLGFVFSMIFAHAPLIVPVVLKQRVRFTRFAYVPLALLHASLLVRLAAPELRATGGVLNAAAIVLFAATVVASIDRRGTA